MADTSMLASETSGIAAAAKNLADTALSISDLLKRASDILPNETRSIVFEVNNLTSRFLTNKGNQFVSGGFGPTLPEGRIAPFRSDVFSLESSGIATGVNGMVTYEAEGIGAFSVAADNPFIGNNSVNVFSNPNVDAAISILGQHSTGNHNHARFTVIEKTVSAQSDWRFCRKCQCIFFDGFPTKGVCPAAGGGHEAAGFVFVLPHDFAASDHAQGDWRFCRKCQVLFFDGFPTKGVCPAAGGGHEAAGFVFVLPHDFAASDHAQGDWRFCRKCQVLFFDGFPTKGVCPAAGGGHEAAGFVFILNHS